MEAFDLLSIGVFDMEVTYFFERVLFVALFLDNTIQVVYFFLDLFWYDVARVPYLFIWFLYFFFQLL